MFDVIAFILANFQIVIGALLIILSGLSLLAALTPTKKDDEFIGKLQKFFSGLKKKESK